MPSTSFADDLPGFLRTLIQDHGTQSCSYSAAPTASNKLQKLGDTLISQFNTAYFDSQARSRFVSLNDLNHAADALLKQDNAAFENHWYEDSDTATRYILSALAWATTNVPQINIDGVEAAMQQHRITLPRNDTLHTLERLVNEEHLTSSGDRLTYRYTVPLYRRWVAWHWPPQKIREEKLG